MAYHKVGDFRRAIAQLETLWVHQPEFPGTRRGLAQAYFARGLTLLQAKQPSESLGFFRKSEALAQDADVLFAEGLAHLRLGDLAGAEAAFAGAVGLDPDPALGTR